ncbi:hypothetical protein EGJ57_04515 [Brucella anthropi]|uniref:hypothetical protein n=1 Tax=Brucella anthropi TaxID=529 RepID=UPI000F660E70|nr:hypothetical protein [Brucella anthropi]RRY22037.1 hypothetical protein EGJ57_04515 [Brucella anthropi]
MSALNSTLPEQVEPNPQSPVVTNPAKQAFNITVSVPDQITIKMVDASGLSDYEVNLYISSLAFGAFCGLLVATVQEGKSNSGLVWPFGVMTALTFLIFAAFFLMALKKRSKLTRSGKEIKLETTGATID